MSRSFCRSRMRASRPSSMNASTNSTPGRPGSATDASCRPNSGTRGGALIAGLTGWTWGGCGYIDVLWVREDRRGRGLGRRLLDAAETEAHERGCTHIVTPSHSFQAPKMYRARGYVEYGRIDDYPRGFAHIHFVKDLP